jgi:hypothetical protein
MAVQAFIADISPWILKGNISSVEMHN